MEADIRDLLDEVIEEGLSGLVALEAGSEKRTVEIDNVSKLYRLRIEEGKSDREYFDKQENRTLSEKQLTEQKKTRLADTAVKIGGIIGPMVLSGFCFFAGLKFEETGTIGSRMMNWLMQQIKTARK